jgi:RND superfamily putative drug exporter
VFVSLGRVVVRWRWAVVLGWLLLAGAGSVFAVQVPDRLVAGGFSSPELEAAQAYESYASAFDRPLPVLTLIIHDSEGRIGTPAALDEIERLRAAALAVEGVGAVQSLGEAGFQRSPSGNTVFLHISTDLETARAHTLTAPVNAAIAGSWLEVRLAGPAAYYHDIEQFTKSDLQRAELLGVPFLLLVLLAVFGSLPAATLPLVMGAISVGVGLALIWLVAGTVEISIFALNIATLLGLGLGVDYSLFLVSRYRRELSRADPRTAVVATCASMGKTIAFSATAVIIGLTALTMFEFQFLRSIGIVGALVTAVAALCALTLAPAVLAILGTSINRFRVLPRLSGGGRLWARTARAVMKHPLMVLVPVTMVLLAFAVPLAEARISLPDARVLPQRADARQAFELLESEYGPGQLAQLFLVLEFADGPFSEAALEQQLRLVNALEADPRVATTSGIVSIDPRITLDQYRQLYANGPAASDPIARAAAAASTSGELALIGITPSVPGNSAAGRELVYAIRDRVSDLGLRGQLGGGAANYTDFVDAVYGTFPIVIGVILLATLVLLASMFHSLVLPLKAVALNLLSLTTSFGAVVLIFQFGWLAPLLGFEPLGYIDATLPVILFAVLFGLSMDYEVFLLAQVQENWLESGDVETAVANGLQASGRVITSGALVVIVVGLAFASAEVVTVKALGVAGAIAIATDAAIVRSLLAPAAMKLAGAWNWWMPLRAYRLQPR